ncbi:MAG: TOBE domain-containing protein [Bacteroidota bacterium]
MNTIKGEITAITVKGSLSLVNVNINDIKLSAIIIDTPDTAPYLQVGKNVNVIFKETEVILTTDGDPQISLQNRLPGNIESIEEGSLLSKVVLDTQAGVITSIITTNAVNQLKLKRGYRATAMIKTNEMMLSEW